MRESLARIERPEPEEEPAQIIHPEAANDNEVVQPISTIYAEAPSEAAVAELLAETNEETGESIPEETNDEEIQAVLEKLHTRAEETKAESVESHETAESHEEAAPPDSAAGGSKKDGGGDGNQPKKTKPLVAGGHDGHAEEKAKGPFGKFIGGFFKTLLLLTNFTIWAVTTAVRKTTETFMKAMGDTGSGGHKSAAKPKATGGHGGGGGHH